MKMQNLKWRRMFNSISEMIYEMKFMLGMK